MNKTMNKTMNETTRVLFVSHYGTVTTWKPFKLTCELTEVFEEANRLGAVRMHLCGDVFYRKCGLDEWVYGHPVGRRVGDLYSIG